MHCVRVRFCPNSSLLYYSLAIVGHTSTYLQSQVTSGDQTVCSVLQHLLSEVLSAFFEEQHENNRYITPHINYYHPHLYTCKKLFFVGTHDLIVYKMFTKKSKHF